MYNNKRIFRLGQKIIKGRRQRVTGKILLVTLHSLMHFADSLEKKIIGKMEREAGGGKACSIVPNTYPDPL